MNELELKNIWKSYDQKLERLLQINYQQLKTIQSQKAESRIRSFIRGHLFVMLLGVAWIGFLAFLVYHTLDNIYFTASVGTIIVFNVFAVLAYLKHIVILLKVDVAGSITETQRQLVRVNTSYINVGRILLLQVPFYCVWWYNDDLIQNAGPLFWSIQVVVVTALTAFAIYLFVRLSPKNRSGSLAKRVDNAFGAAKLQSAVAFLDEIEEFKKENMQAGDS